MDSATFVSALSELKKCACFVLLSQLSASVFVSKWISSCILDDEFPAPSFQVSVQSSLVGKFTSAPVVGLPDLQQFTVRVLQYHNSEDRNF